MDGKFIVGFVGWFVLEKYVDWFMGLVVFGVVWLVIVGDGIDWVRL